MIDSEIEQLIVRRLSAGTPPEELTTVVAERTGMAWNAAREEVFLIRRRNHERIAKRRAWVYLAIWIPTFVAGSVATTWGIVRLIDDPLQFTLDSLLDHEMFLAFFGCGILALGGSILAVIRKR